MRNILWLYHACGKTNDKKLRILINILDIHFNFFFYINSYDPDGQWIKLAKYTTAHSKILFFFPLVIICKLVKLECSFAETSAISATYKCKNDGIYKLKITSDTEMDA